MYAVIKSGGKQYRVKEGQVLRVEKLDTEQGADVIINDVLLVGEGENITVGRPIIEGAAVTAVVMEHGKGKKIDVIKFKRRKNYRRTKGHRQLYTQIKIKQIQA
jgi:large subunit ribosomal protein L21